MKSSMLPLEPKDLQNKLLEIFLETLVAGTVELAEERRQKLIQHKLNCGDPEYCPLTLDRHVLVTFHSAPPAERQVCIDCGAQFRDDDAILTKPHGRSKL